MIVYKIFNWWMQLAGYDKVREFYQYQSAENFNWQNIKTVESSFYTIYKAAQDSFSRA